MYRDSDLSFRNSNTTRCADHHFVWEYTRPANDVCQDAAFLFKDRPELIPWVYGEAWETSSFKVWVLTLFGVGQIDLSLA